VGHEAETDRELAEHRYVPDIRADTLRGATYRVLARG
jgi:hypothetical protein